MKDMGFSEFELWTLVCYMNIQIPMILKQKITNDGLLTSLYQNLMILMYSLIFLKLCIFVLIQTSYEAKKVNFGNFHLFNTVSLMFEKCLILLIVFVIIILNIPVFSFWNFEVLIQSLALAQHIFKNSISRHHYIPSQTKFCLFYGMILIHNLFSDYYPSTIYKKKEFTYIFGIQVSYLIIFIFCVLLGILFAQEECHPLSFLSQDWKHLLQYNYFKKEEDLNGDLKEMCSICSSNMEHRIELKKDEQRAMMSQSAESEMHEMLELDLKDQGINKTKQYVLLSENKQSCQTWKDNVKIPSVLAYLEQNLKGSNYMETPCKHIFHCECLLSWIQCDVW